MKRKITEQWFDTHNLIPAENDHPDWGIQISGSTVPLTYWIANKSKIPDKDLWLGMSLHRMFDCKVNLISKDERFKVNWRDGYLPDVTSDSFLHRTKTPWPEFNTPDDFNDLVRSIEQILKINFHSIFNVEAYSLNIHGVKFLAQWLSPLAESITFKLGELYGDIPNELIDDDNRSNGGGITLCVPSNSIASLA